jgi:hypothetical protein
MDKSNAVTAEVKKLTARVTALERLMERTRRQKPVSEKQLAKALKRTQVENKAFIGKLIKRVGRGVGGVLKRAAPVVGRVT